MRMLTATRVTIRTNSISTGGRNPSGASLGETRGVNVFLHAKPLKHVTNLLQMHIVRTMATF